MLQTWNYGRSLFLAGLLAIGLTAGTVGSASAASDTRRDIVVGVNALPVGLDPVAQDGNVSIRVTFSIYDTLIRRNFMSDGKGMGSKLIPGLATSWHRVDDRTLELKLRQGVKFHDGSEFTADDVVFTFSPERLWGKNSVLPDGRAYFGHLEKVEAVDKYTVRITTQKPDAVLEQRLATYGAWIVSKKSWVDAVHGDTSNPNWMSEALKVVNRKPVGTGPLKFVEWKEGDYQKFAAFDDWYGGKPNFKTVTFKQVPELASRIAGLVSGEFDLIVNIPPDQISVFKRYKELQTKGVVLANTQVLVINANHPLLKDKRVRQALSLAIDRDTLVKALWAGQAFVPNGHQMADFGDMYNPDRKPPQYDPEKAKALLKAAGYKGEEIVLRTMSSYYINALAASQIIQQMWKKVGVNMKLEIVENFTQTRTPDVMIYPWSNSFRLPDPMGGIWPLYGDASAIQKKYKYWTAPAEFNRLGNVVESSMDPKERYQAFQGMLDIFEDDVPAIPLYNAFETYAMKRDIDWTPYPLFFMDFRPDVFKMSEAAKRP